jgi:hypothetical protein
MVDRMIEEAKAMIYGPRWNIPPVVRAMLESLCAALEARAPEGWVLVPKEPTREMILAAYERDHDGTTSLYHKVWAAMLAAAPASPSARDVVPTDLARNLLDEVRRDYEGEGEISLDLCARIRAFLDAPDAAPAQEGMVNGRTEIELLREYRTATEYWQLQPMDAKERTEHFKRFDLLAALPSAPTPGMGKDMGSLLAAIRGYGWLVAVHNDYMLGDERHTFWLFTNEGRAIKGEARTDAEALSKVLSALTGDGASRASPAEGGGPDGN